MKNIIATLIIFGAIITNSASLAIAQAESNTVSSTATPVTTPSVAATSSSIDSIQTLVVHQNLEQKWQTANAKFIYGDYPMAILLYEELLGTGLHSAVLYTNLGDAYFRHNNLGKAILNYHRSLLLAPADKDARHNLEVAMARTTDKIVPLPRVFITEWISTIRDMMSSDAWAVITLVMLALTLAGVAVWLLSTKLLVRKIGFYGALVSASFTIISLAFSQSGHNRQTSSPVAIVITSMVSVKNSPDASSKELFVLHEGTPVTALDGVQGWVEVKTEDGNTGWVQSNTIEKIVAK